MKIKSDYMIRNIAGTNVVVPIGERVIEFKGMMTLNESAAYIWGFLKEDRTYEEVLAALLEEFDVDEAVAKSDLNDLLDQMKKSGVLEL